MLLGISQKRLEDEYYMVDLPLFIERKRKETVTDYFMQLQLRLASNNRMLPEEDYEAFIRNLTKNLEGENTEKADQFDRQKFEALRLMTNMGANRTGGR